MHLDKHRAGQQATCLLTCLPLSLSLAAAGDGWPSVASFGLIEVSLVRNIPLHRRCAQVATDEFSDEGWRRKGLRLETNRSRRQERKRDARLETLCNWEGGDGS